MPKARARPTLAQRRPWVIAFLFGLLHGMAFAGVLADIGLPPGEAPKPGHGGEHHKPAAAAAVQLK